jgi:hypothetical protein
MRGGFASAAESYVGMKTLWQHAPELKTQTGAERFGPVVLNHGALGQQTLPKIAQYTNPVSVLRPCGNREALNRLIAGFVSGTFDLEIPLVHGLVRHLQVLVRVPVRVVNDDGVRRHEVDAQPARARGQQEHEVPAASAEHPSEHGAGSSCASLYALASMFLPKLSSHTHTHVLGVVVEEVHVLLPLLPRHRAVDAERRLA